MSHLQDPSGNLNESLDALFEALDEASVLLDVDGNPLKANRAALRLFGTESFADWQPLWDDFLASGCPFKSISEQAQQGPAKVSCSYDALGLDLTLKLKSLSWSGSSALLLVLHDDRAQNKLSRELDRQNRFLRQILDTDPNLIYIKDQQGRFIEANRAVANLYGTTTEELLGQTERDFNQVEEDVAAYLEADRKVLAHKEPLFIPEEHFLSVYGEDLYLQTIKVPLIDEDGEARRVLGVSTDITSRKRAEQSMLESKNAAEEANRAKSEFLANMSHEIRTPMNAILGFTDILGGMVVDPKQKEFLDSIHSSGKSLLNLINDILDLSKVEAGKLELEAEPLELAGFLKEVAMIFSQKVLEKSLAWKLELDPKMPAYVALDAGRLRQILLNLVGNAVKFTETGEVSLKVGGTPEGEVVDLSFEITDTGVGISPEYQDRIFGAFEQQPAQERHNYGGTGLGLTITKKLTEMMGGKIDLQSEVGQGSTFKLTLPKVPVLKQVHRAEREHPELDPKSLVFDPAVVLVVDDIKANRQLIQGFLPYEELSVIEASSGKEALEMAAHYHPDLILMDLKMPGLDGEGALKRLRAERQTAQIPVVMLTASVMIDQKARLSPQFEGFLPKPIERSALLECLCRFLGHRVLGGEDAQGSNARKGLTTAEFEAKPALAALLKDEYLPRGRELLVYQTINDIEDFAQSLSKLAQTEGEENLGQWAQALREQCDRFDIQGITLLLNELDRALSDH